MRRPLRFAHGNLLWDGSGGVWALYRLPTRAYAEQPRAERLAMLGDLAALFAGLERDWQLLRVSRGLSPDAYAAQALATADRRHADPRRLGAYLAGHAAGLAGAARAEVYLAARLRAAAGGRRSRAARALGLAEPLAIGARALAALRAAEAEALASIEAFVAAERAGSEDVAWLVLRSYARGAAEPLRPSDWRPQALVLADEADGALLRPLEHDLLRLFECPIEVGRRSLAFPGDAGESHQALLVLGALPEEAPFPDPRSEHLFWPLESLEFPVDACLWASPVPNREAAALVRRRIVDADNIAAEEAVGDHGPSAIAAARPAAARELEDYLADPARPPLLRASVGLAVGAPDPAELERRVAELRRAYAGIDLHRPPGSQLDLWMGHLPGQPAPIRDYEDHLLVEQAAAMVPLASREVGTEAGPLLGRALSGSARPVLFDLAAASLGSRPPSVLLLGAPGMGKTLALELLVYQAWLAGSRVVDIDPKGDHRLEGLPGLSEDLEVIELSGEGAPGLLDPLAVAPAGQAADAAAAFLVDVLPPPVPAEWRTEIRRAVAAVMAERPGAGCAVVLQRLLGADGAAAAAGRALAVHAEGGLARLGFAAEGRAPGAARAGVTQLRIRGLPRPEPGTPRAELAEDERVGQALLRLLAAYAMRLLGEDRSRHKVIAIDEAFVLLADAAGRRLVEHLNRWGRSEFATPILATHLVADAGEMDNLVGARFVFGMESEAEARGALALLHLDPEDASLRRRLAGFRRGACLLRDWEGRVGAMRIEIPEPALLAALDTTPRRGA